MAQKTNLNISPYFDDFDNHKNYYKVLFNSGKPIQSRELNTLQSILQDQIESFGSHIFKEGSMVIPGNLTYDSQFHAVKLNSVNFGIDISVYINNFIGKKIIGQTSGLSAIVQEIVFPDPSIEVDNITLYVKYIDSGDSFDSISFLDGESLYSDTSIVYGNTTISSGEVIASLIDLGATSIASSVSIGEGIYFIRGNFVNVNQETLILDYYSNSPSYRIGLKVTEQIVTAKDDPSLYDNAKGFNNYSAPGADRFKIGTTLTKKSLTDIDDTDFVELLRVENGAIKKLQPKTQYNIIKDYLAKRTYDESGDYVVDPFQISVNNSLNDRLGNDGLFLSEEKTKQNNTPSDDLLCVKISPGTAYVRGYDIEKTETIVLDVDKPRDTQELRNVSIPFEMGNLIRVNNVTGYPILRNAIVLSGKRSDGSTTTTIGSAKVYNFNLTDSAYSGNDTTWDLYLFDIQTYTSITLTSPLSNSELPKSSFVKGKSSGASGYAVSSGNNSDVITLNQTSGTFISGESILINGIEDSPRSIKSISVYSTEDIKSVFQSGTPNFAADTVLDFKTPYGISPLDEISITDLGSNIGIATITGKLATSIKPNSIIKYTKSGDKLPTYNLVTSVSNDGISINLASVTAITNVNEGSLPTNQLKTTFSIGFPIIRNEQDGYLYTKLPNINISSLNLSNSNLRIAAQSKSTFVSGSTITANRSDFNFSSSININNVIFTPFDEERYSVFYTDGTIFKLSDDKITLSTDSTQITINGLNPSKTVAKINATFTKTSIQSKVKIYNRNTILPISYSKYIKSGNNSNSSVNDGLTYNQYYGLRVQDEEICLNYPDVSKIVKVYESLDINEPILDQVQFSSLLDVQTNAIIGEHIVGSQSNCVATVVRKPNAYPNNLDVVYLNGNRFIVGETVSFEESNLNGEVVDIISGKYKDITNNYLLDGGQKDQYYDYSKLVRNKNQQEPSKKLLVIFDNYTVPVNDTGDVFTVLSYDENRFSNDIPYIGKQSLRASDTLDFRPRVVKFSSNTSSPFDSDSRIFADEPKIILTPNENSLIGYSFYLPRIDKLYLDKLGNFILEKGISSLNPKSPTKNDQVLELATISLPAYLYRTKDAVISLIDNKRYTMRDIGKIENRVQNLEKTTSLSLLELNTQSLQIQDAQGFNRFRTGFFVDDFKNKDLINPILSSVEIDKDVNELIPIISKNTLKPQLLAAKNLSDNTIDYSENFDLLDPNIQKTGDLITLKYDVADWIEQPLATRVENVNPFHVVEYIGNIKLNPPRDNWVRTITLPTNIITNTDTITNTIIDNTRPVLVGPWWAWWWGGWWGLRWWGWWGAPVVRETTSETVSTTQNVKVNETSETKLEASQPETYMRSRNTEFVVTGLRSGTRYYQFLDQNSSVDFIPKLIEISSDSQLQNPGSTKDFVIGETVVGYYNGREIIRFRLAQPNHKNGRYDSPSTTFKINPYNKNESLPSSYSASSSVLNIDTRSLSDEAQGAYSGYIVTATQLIGQTSGAVAYVKEPRLISDNYGDLIGCFFIREPYNDPQPLVRIRTGNKTYALSSSPTNESQVRGSTLISKAETNYISEGTVEYYRTTITRNITVTLTRTITRTVTRTLARRHDPIAQSFTVGQNVQAPSSDQFNDDINGAFLTGVDVFFARKDSGSSPVTVEIRSMDLSSPTLTRIGPSVTLTPEQVNISSDASIPTRFNFEYPIYLDPGNQYALVILAPESIEYEVWIAQMGENTVNSANLPDADSVRYTKQWAIGRFYKSQNGSEWTPDDYQDLKFKLYKCKFTSTNGTAFFSNPTLDRSNGFVQKLLKNAITTYPRKLKVGITTNSDAYFISLLNSGRKISETTKSYNYGYVEKIGGPVGSIGITTGGLNYATSNPVDTYNITGNGSGLTLSITATDGFVSSVSVVGSGTGYAIGDVIGVVTSSTSDKNGKGAAFTITSINNSVDTLYLTNVQGESFTQNAPISLYNNGGSVISLASTVVTYSTQIGQIYDGSYIQVKHSNHGMYAKNNKLTISNVQSNVPSSNTTSILLITDNSTISIASTGNFGTFEGLAVSDANPGYVKINNEIIKYKQVGNGFLGMIERGQDSTIPITHEINSLVYKYELNGISLMRINRDHDIDDNNIDIDSYYISIDRNSSTKTTERLSDKDNFGNEPKNSPQVSFNSESSVGGSDIFATENIAYTKVIPSFESFTPGSSTEINAQIRTISGTSVNGDEVSFNDLGYEPVQLNKLNSFTSTRIVCSKINEQTYLSSMPRQKSLITSLSFSTKDSNISPYIFTDTCFLELQSSRLNSPISDYINDNRVNSLFADPHAMIYVSNVVNLSQASTSLKVIVSAYRDSSSDFRVLYSLIRADSSEVAQSFELFPGYDNLTIDKNNDGFLDIIDPSKNSGLSDSFVPASKKDQFLDYEFTASNLGLFTGYVIKIVASGKNQAFYPRFKDLRTIALR